MATEIKLKDFYNNWIEELRTRVNDGYVNAMKRKPTLTIVQIGANEASNKYVDYKIKDCKKVGIQGEVYKIPESAGMTTKDLINLLRQCESDGVIVQLPVPHEIDVKKASLAGMSWAQDVDGSLPGSPYTPATPKGILKWLDSQNMGEGSGKEALIIGRSDIVGKPMAKLLTDRNYTVTLAHSKSPDIYELAQRKQLIICAVGKPNFLDLNRVPCGATVVDVGTNYVDGKLVGDCAPGGPDTVRVTAVPGGVGLLTRAALLDNVITAWEKNNGK